MRGRKVVTVGARYRHRHPDITGQAHAASRSRDSLGKTRRRSASRSPRQAIKASFGASLPLLATCTADRAVRAKGSSTSTRPLAIVRRHC